MHEADPLDGSLCRVCGEGILAPVKDDFQTVEYNGHEIQVPLCYHKCSVCGVQLTPQDARSNKSSWERFQQRVDNGGFSSGDFLV